MSETVQAAKTWQPAKTFQQALDDRLQRAGPAARVSLTDRRCMIALGEFEIRDPDEVQLLHAAVATAKAETFGRIEQEYQDALRESEAARLYQAALAEHEELQREAGQTGPRVEELQARKRRLLASGTGGSIAAQLTTTSRLLDEAAAKHDDVQARLAALAEAIAARKQEADADVSRAISRAYSTEQQRCWQESREAFEQLLGQRPGGGAEALRRIVAVERGNRTALTQAQTDLRANWQRAGETARTARRPRPAALPEPAPLATVQHPTIGEVTRVAEPPAAPVG